jgi:branched-chain amino acid transport system ATP-binding protein
MAKPRLLLLDEPSLGLAPLVVRDIFQTIEAISKDEQLGVLVVEQNAQIALGISQHGYLLETGRVVLSGTAEELRATDVVQRSYLGR